MYKMKTSDNNNVMLVFPLKLAIVLSILFVMVAGDTAEHIGTQFFVFIATFNTSNHVRILGGIIFLTGTYFFGDNVVGIAKWVFSKVKALLQTLLQALSQQAQAPVKNNNSNK